MSKINIQDATDGCIAFGHRDAIHTPIIRMFSKLKLKPGQRVIFLDDVTCYPWLLDEPTYDGIVSPFIENETIEPNTGVWVLVHPRLLDGTVQHYFQVHHPKLTEQYVTNEEYDECKGCYN